MKNKVSVILEKMIENSKQHYNFMLDDLLSLKEELLKADTILQAYPVKDRMTYKKDIGYFIKLEDGTEDGPFCPSCWDVRKKLVHLEYSLCENWSEWELSMDKQYYDLYECPNKNCRYYHHNYNIPIEICDKLDILKNKIIKKNSCDNTNEVL